jgi:NAD(P)-dependent dehydrogenase (short-subunit alcohol dehydrogenase family)
MKDFAGRVAVITGAGTGFGRAFAQAAAARGMKLVLADLDADALEAATDALLAGGAEVLAMVCDVSKCSHVEELADAAMIRFHGVHLLFNHAGDGVDGPIWAVKEADWERMLGENLWGAIHGARIFTPLMLDCARRQPGYQGHIVNALRKAGQGALRVPGQALLALSENLRDELRLADAPLAVSVLSLDDPQAEASAVVAERAFAAIGSGEFLVGQGSIRQP